MLHISFNIYIYICSGSHLLETWHKNNLVFCAKIIISEKVKHVMINFPGILTMIMVRTLRKDIAKYNRDEDYVSSTLAF